MPSLYKLIDAMSDMIISVVYTSGSDSHNSEPSMPAESEPGNNNRSSSRSSYHCNIKYNDKDNDRYPTHQDQLPYPPSKRRPTIPYSKTRVRGTSSEYLAPKRFTKTPPTTKNVHWSNMMEVDGEAYRFTAPALNSYPLRRRRKANYVYGADGGDSNNNVHNTEDRDSSPEPQEPYSAAASYEEQRYPNDRYSGPGSRSGSRNHSPAGSYPGADRGRSQSRPPGPREASRPDMPRSILKPPTATDDEMLLRNTWGIIARQEQQINYMYEFLSDVLLVGHDVLDCMFETGEISMWEETTRRAQQAQQALGRGSRASSPIPRQQQFEGESQGQPQYPAPYPGQSPTLSSRPRRAFEEELKRREARQSPPGVYSPVLGSRGSHTDPWLDAQRSSLGEDPREASPVPGERPSSSPRFDGRPELLYGREGAMSRQEETRSPAPGVRGIDTIYEDPEEQ
ncbi:hypothetical protein BJY01DRAFT_247716 [Aspergillus pseudoustus]|uniref:Uncharacterized protein n=1 Tax=Aspergillus pseudoustus TaxID=1810923 RepID=A0ABR4JZE1_9EURO